MTDIPARLVKQLRDLTGAPMMDCKRALEEAGGDVEQARQILREKGIASAGKRAGRETTEGKVRARAEDGHGAIVAVGCETEPVSKNDEFLSFVQKLLDQVESNGPEAAAALEDERIELVGRIGENVVVRGTARIEVNNGEALSAYVHPPAEKIGVLVRVKGSPEVARQLAMHISFASPRYRTRDEVPEGDVAAERAIYEKLPDVVEKPEHIRPQIVEGKLTKEFFAQTVLADQAWIHDPGKKVGQALEEAGAEVIEFVRYSVSE
ncbi:MAG: translation elongation factor Ts [Actinomycetota bacterium]|nr:translation elongation factor Ts [Actinomycetota bacterium]